ncbi:hypothetical protein TRVA0_005S02102 [Trichomonascus vanleenenianus]|uniref:uncharacterized protein n=1 Tax=Trichomonascus vanleenenianus TaxID=2268995 RepID=UPI003ECA0D3E
MGKKSSKKGKKAGKPQRPTAASSKAADADARDALIGVLAAYYFLKVYGDSVSMFDGLRRRLVMERPGHRPETMMFGLLVSRRSRDLYCREFVRLLLFIAHEYSNSSVLDFKPHIELAAGEFLDALDGCSVLDRDSNLMDLLSDQMHIFDRGYNRYIDYDEEEDDSLLEEGNVSTKTSEFCYMASGGRLSFSANRNELKARERTLGIASRRPTKLFELIRHYAHHMEFGTGDDPVERALSKLHCLLVALMTEEGVASESESASHYNGMANSALVTLLVKLSFRTEKFEDIVYVDDKAKVGFNPLSGYPVALGFVYIWRLVCLATVSRQTDTTLDLFEPSNPWINSHNFAYNLWYECLYARPDRPAFISLATRVRDSLAAYIAENRRLGSTTGSKLPKVEVSKSQFAVTTFNKNRISGEMITNLLLKLSKNFMAQLLRHTGMTSLVYGARFQLGDNMDECVVEETGLELEMINKLAFPDIHSLLNSGPVSALGESHTKLIHDLYMLNVTKLPTAKQRDELMKKFMQLDVLLEWLLVICYMSLGGSCQAREIVHWKMTRDCYHALDDECDCDGIQEGNMVLRPGDPHPNIGFVCHYNCSTYVSEFVRKTALVRYLPKFAAELLCRYLAVVRPLQVYLAQRLGYDDAEVEQIETYIWAGFDGAWDEGRVYRAIYEHTGAVWGTSITTREWTEAQSALQSSLMHMMKQSELLYEAVRDLPDLEAPEDDETDNVMPDYIGMTPQLEETCFKISNAWHSYIQAPHILKQLNEEFFGYIEYVKDGV